LSSRAAATDRHDDDAVSGAAVVPNPYILKSVEAVWSEEIGRLKTILDLSCGGGATSRMLAGKGFAVVATDYCPPPFLGDAIPRVGGLDLNEPLPFKSRSFDAVNLIEVIEHIEHQPQLIREIARVLKDEGVVVISTPNVLNVFSRLRFLFTGFLRGRVRPLHYKFGPGRAHNIHLIHFYELYYLVFHAGFEIEKLGTTRVKFASLFFMPLLYPFMWLCSLPAVIWPEQDPVQRRINWQILRFLCSSPLLLSDNIVVKARKKRDP
jgi:2-polyprenyl-3-methyl-5-hydroxy-6-metoxy-1,4-benzoquinol methylase